MVFDCNDGVDHVLRNIFILDNGSVAVREVETLDFIAICIIHDGTLADL